MLVYQRVCALIFLGVSLDILGDEPTEPSVRQLMAAMTICRAFCAVLRWLGTLIWLAEVHCFRLHWSRPGALQLVDIVELSG